MKKSLNEFGLRIIKSSLPILIFLIFYTPAFSQIFESIVNPKKVWATVFQSDADGFYYTYKFKVGPDTILYQGQKYLNVYRSDNKETQNEWHLIGIIRQDSSKRVFFQNPFYTPDTVYLLYDFNHTVNDTFRIMSFFMGRPCEEIPVRLDSIKTIQIINKPVNVYYISYTLHSGFSTIWIEGIGSLFGLLTNIYPPFLDGLGTNELLCFSENDTIKYINQKYNTCFYTTAQSATEIFKESSVSSIVAPNPITSISYLKVIGKEFSKLSIEFYDYTGIKLYHSQFDKNEFCINKDLFKPGVYFYKIVYQNKIISTGKFIVL